MLDYPDGASVSIGRSLDQRGAQLRPQSACSLASSLKCEDFGSVAQSCVVVIGGDRAVRGLGPTRPAIVSRWMIVTRFPIVQRGVIPGVVPWVLRMRGAVRNPIKSAGHSFYP